MFRTARQLTTALTATLLGLLALAPAATANYDNSLPGDAATDIAALAIGGGDVHEFGDAVFMGSLSDVDLDNPVAAMAAIPNADGYWIVTDAGEVHAFGDAPHLGDTSSVALAAPIVDITSTPSGNGYWMAASDGGIFAFGDAAFFGSTGAIRLAQPVVAMASTPSGNGYWMAAADGGIFAFGDAGFLGSTGNLRLVSPVATMLSTSSGNGYWLFAEDGGVFAFGDAPFLGSAAGTIAPGDKVVGGAPNTAGTGYWLATDAGTVMAFGDAPDHGGVAASGGEMVAAIESSGDGYWLTTTLGHETFGPAVPVNSGSGRRIVYSNSDQRVWLIEADESVTTTHLVSGKINTPMPGSYAVFSESRNAWAGHDGITMEYMVRFTWGRTLAIGFHSIPKYSNGQPMQTEEQLGTYRSAGCVRQRVDQAKFLYDWAEIGTPVIVVA